MLIKLAINALAVWLAVLLIDGLEFDGEWYALLAIAVVLAIVNAVVKPIVTVLSLPFVVLTLGLFLLLVNTAMFWLTIRISEALDLGLTSTGFGATFLGGLVIAIVTWAGERAFAKR